MRILLAALGLTMASQAAAISLTLTHPFGEVIDEGQVEAQIAPGPGMMQDCAAPVRAEFPRPFEVLLVSGKVPAQPFTCPEAAKTRIGPLEAGTWTFVVEYYDRGGVAPSERLVSPQRVYRKGLACNPDPHLNSLWVMHRTMKGADLVTSLMDPAFAAQMQNPVASYVPGHSPGGAYLEYAPLVNRNLVRERILATGQFQAARPTEAFCIGVPHGPVMGRMIEFHHAVLDQYFYTDIEAEVDVLDSGTIAGWKRTGLSFEVMLGVGCPQGLQIVYRFWGKPGLGPSSHVFITDREECAIAEQSGWWVYEGTPFWSVPPGIEGCPAGVVPLYRAWRSVGETRHRFSTDRSVFTAMAKDGWVDEGVRMCVWK